MHDDEQRYLSAEQMRGYLPHGGYPGGMPPPPPVAAAAPQYAHWGLRVAASLLDTVIPFVVYFPLLLVAALATDTPLLAENANGVQISPFDITGPIFGWGVFPDTFQWISSVLYAAFLGFLFWNQVYRQGRTGQSIGKSLLHLRLIGEESGAPVGVGRSFLRQIAHVLDSLPCYLGYLWPLWDDKRQTFADKICKTIVVPVPPTETRSTP